MDIRPEKYVSICSDSQGALEALEAAKITTPTVPKGFERHSHQAFCGIVLGAWAF